MKKHLVFFHQNYPAQFGPITQFLLEECDVDVTFFSEFIAKPVYPGIKHYFYKRDTMHTPETPYFFTRYFEQEARSMYGVYKAFEAVKEQMEAPDAFIGHVGFGNLMLLHVAYPNIPSIGYFEIFYNPFDPTSLSRRQFPVPKENILRIPLRNATQLIELEYCTKGYSPTPYQKSTFPTAYQDKISVLFDGVNTELYKPGEVTSQSELKPTWPADAKLITYSARGLESFRGFDVFMDAAYKLSQMRDDVHFIIAGDYQTHYGPEAMHLKGKSFKDHVLEQHPFDLSRFHFLHWISEPALVDLFRISHCHFYWTIPFTLSWSLFQSLSTETLVLASNSAPVRDLIVDGENGILFDPYNVDEIVEKMNEIVDNQEKYVPLRKAARETIVSNYSLQVCLPRLADFYLSSTRAPMPNIPSLITS